MNHPSILSRKFWSRVFHKKTTDGSVFYYANVFNKNSAGSNMDLAVNHPILTTAILFLSKIYSQVEFYIEDKETKEKIYNHELLSLLSEPNEYQNQDDFLNTVVFAKIANGSAVIYKKKPTGFSTDSIYILDYNLIDFGDDFKTRLSFKGSDILEHTITYDANGVNLKIQIKDLVFINDLPNGLNAGNMYDVGNRIDGIRDTLINTIDSIHAKNVILQTNGRDLITNSGGKDGFPLIGDEKTHVESLANNKYGLGRGRLRTIITNADLTWKSMHIALRDLGFDESIKTDAAIVFSALQIPKDILSLEGQKIKYDNFRQSMISFLQNQVQSDIDYLCRKLSIGFELDKRYALRGNFNHLPIMQFILKEKFEGIKAMGEALLELRKAGLPDDIALAECGLDSNIKLNNYEVGGTKEEISTEAQEENEEEE